MLDVVQIVLWSITYILTVYFMHRNHKIKAITFPLPACLMNISWEIVAIVASGGFWGHIIWLSLDVIIFTTLIAYLSKEKRKNYLILLVLFVYIIASLFFCKNGALISVFIIDLIMAVCFWVDRKKIYYDGKIIIATTKLFGDLAAAIFYSPEQAFVFLCGVAVLILNTSYLIYSILERIKIEKQKKGAP